MRPAHLLAAAVAAAFATQTSAQAPKVVMEEMTVPSEPGIEIYVRNKRPADLSAFRPERTVLFVHGATYPAHTSFDLKLDGMSWMDYIAARGYDVYLLDLRGYGRSSRPKEMDEAPEANPPIVRGTAAVKDISAVVDFILARRGIARLNLLGWSWGTTLMATYTTQNPGKVERLVLYAPAWIRTTPSLSRPPGPLGAYCAIAREQAKTRWLTGVPEDKKATLIPPGWFDAWADATFATDPVGAKMSRRSSARPTASSRTAMNSSPPGGRTTTPPRSRRRRCSCTRNGTATLPPTWLRPCSRSSSTRRASATSSCPRARTPS